MNTDTGAPVPKAAHWVDVASHTNCGLRQDNQDRVYCDFQTLAVFDGVGGRAFGGTAAMVALAQTLLTLSESRQQGMVGLVNALQVANEVLLEANQRMGFDTATTATVMALYERQGTPYLSIAWVGDTPAYLIRGDGVLKLTRPHEVLDRASTVPHFRLTRWLGDGPAARADIQEVLLQEGDRLVIVSDGVTSVVDDGTLGGIIAQADSAHTAAVRLVAAAIKGGTHDNATAAVAIIRNAEMHHTLSGGLLNLRPEQPSLEGDHPSSPWEAGPPRPTRTDTVGEHA